MTSANYSIFVTGGTTAVGALVLTGLSERGCAVCCLGRHELKSTPSQSWRLVDLEDPSGGLPDVHANILIHTASSWLLQGWIEQFHARGVRRIVAFSSTSRFTKNSSASPYERDLVRRLVDAEKHIQDECERLGITWTVFRPTLIYGGKGTDRNIADIARVIRRFGVFPILGAAQGSRQPVDAADLADACLKVLANHASYNKSYDLCGGETLTYRDMVVRIFQTLGRKPVFLHVPMIFFRCAIRLFKWHPRFSHLTPEMALRMQMDLVFDAKDAIRDFGYSPGKFNPTYLKNID